MGDKMQEVRKTGANRRIANLILCEVSASEVTFSMGLWAGARQDLQGNGGCASRSVAR